MSESTFPYKFEPMAHQRAALKRAFGKTAFALFHEMGVGKTYTTINLAGGYYRGGHIKAVVVICPTPIKLVWDLEVEKMSPVDAEVYVLSSGDKGMAAWMKKDNGKLKYLVVGVEALSAGKAFDHALAFVRHFRSDGVLGVVDESSKIKNAQAARTKKCAKIGGMCNFRIILTGTPITQGIEDLYGQFQFLDPSIINCKSYFVFKSMYCLMGGFENRNIIGYQREEELLNKLVPYVDIIKSEEAIDLPEKTFLKLNVDPTKQQLAAMKSLKDLFEATSGDDTLTVSTILERMTRYQQIVGGNFPYDDEATGKYLTKPIEGKNPKMDALLDSIETLGYDRKVIIWARFRPEIELIADTLREKFGPETVVEFHGGVDDSGRREAIEQFQSPDTMVRFFVVNQQTGSMGITLTAATYAYYYSNSFSFEERVQSEKRNHRKGQEHHCTYIDLEMNIHEDKMILAAIGRKQGLATYVEEQLR